MVSCLMRNWYTGTPRPTTTFINIQAQGFLQWKLRKPLEGRNWVFVPCELITFMTSNNHLIITDPVFALKENFGSFSIDHIKYFNGHCIEISGLNS